MEENKNLTVSQGINHRTFPIYIKSEKFEKLLVMQNIPEVKIWFQNQEISMEDLIKVLEKAEL